MLSVAQAWYLEGLRAQSPNSVEIAEEPAEGEGIVTLYVAWPGIYLLLSPSGEVLEHRTKTQWEASVLQ